MLTYMKQIFTLVKMVQLFPLTDERMKRNEEKRKEKIRPPDSISGWPLLHFGAALVIESGGLIFSSCFSLFLLILSSVRGESCTILTSIKSCFRQDRHAEFGNYPFNAVDSTDKTLCESACKDYFNVPIVL